jgi:hypothetical protein
MIEVFKTNVQDATQADAIIALLLQYLPGSKITFDLEDCDNILRIDGIANAVPSMLLINVLKDNGCIAEILPDDVHPIAEVTVELIVI